MLMFDWFCTSRLFLGGQEGGFTCYCLIGFTLVIFFQGVRMGYLHANVRMVSHLSSFFSGSGGSFYMLMFDWFYTSYLF
jgi:hypothetical protein